MVTVKQLSRLAGVTPRTLHYYDQIGLLAPETRAANGYRYYGDDALLRLQQILFYRELGLELDEIKQILARPDFDLLTALEQHRQALEKRVRRLERLIRTVDDTILHLKGQKDMSKKGLFAAFSEEQQEEYARQAEKLYDPQIVRDSNRRWKAYSAEEKQAILDEGNAIYTDLVAAMPKGASAPEAQAIIARWRRHMDTFWTPSLDQLVGLAEMYAASPDFKANFDKIHPDLAAFIGQAVRIYVERHEEEE